MLTHFIFTGETLNFNNETEDASEPPDDATVDESGEENEQGKIKTN